MTIKVEGVWNGSKIGFRMTDNKGRRETIFPAETTTAFPSRKALDLWENLYGYKRRNIRFAHR